MMQYIKGSEMKEYEKKLILTRHCSWIQALDMPNSTRILTAQHQPCAPLENKYSHQRESSIQMKKLGKLQKDVQWVLNPFKPITFK